MFSSSPDSLLFRARLAAAVAVSQVAEAVSVAFPRPDAFRYWPGVFTIAFTFGGSVGEIDPSVGCIVWMYFNIQQTSLSAIINFGYILYHGFLSIFKMNHFAIFFCN